MSKIWLITKREFLQRIRSKGFIIATIIGPLAFVAVMVLPMLIAIMVKDTTVRPIAVLDETGVLFESLRAPGQADLQEADVPMDSLREQLDRGKIAGFLVLPEALLAGEGTAAYYSSGTGGLSLRMELQSAVRDAVRQRRVVETGAPEGVLAIMTAEVPIRMVRVTEAGEAVDTTAILSAIGYAMGFLIYVCVFIYGSIVMSGVIEEKTSRIVEIMASSVKPFELMMGKVLGIGAMGLVQFSIWMGAGFILLALGGTLAMFFVDPASFDLPDTATQEAVLQAAGIHLPEIHFSVAIYFLMFFLGGYLLYASLFAAVGSAVEKESDAQQFTLPITLPVIIPIFFLFHVVDSPDSTLSVILSLVPFFSPILMVVRTAISDVPFWQIALSYTLLVSTFVVAIWVSSRIYRVGILMYGKKPSMRELFRWMRQA